MPSGSGQSALRVLCELLHLLTREEAAGRKPGFMENHWRSLAECICYCNFIYIILIAVFSFWHFFLRLEWVDFKSLCFLGTVHLFPWKQDKEDPSLCSLGGCIIGMTWLGIEPKCFWVRVETQTMLLSHPLDCVSVSHRHTHCVKEPLYLC